MGIEQGPREPFFVDPPHKDPATIPEIAENDIAAIHNLAEAGEISATEAKTLWTE